MRDASLEFFRAILNEPSPPGCEGGVDELFENYTKPFADEVRADLHGNVYAIKNPAAETRIMLAGHTDEIAFIVHYITEEGLLRFKGVGGHDSIIPVGQRVWVLGKERVPGAIGRKAVHLIEDDDERKKKPGLDDLWIDIGVSSREEALKLVSLGDRVVYQHEMQMLAGDRVVARGFDNKMGCFVVAEALRLLSEDGGLHPKVGVYAVGTVQEEIGFRGAITAAYTVDAITGLAVDVSHATDYPTVDRQRHGQLDIGKGPAITLGAYVSPVTSEILIECAKEEGIPHQIEVAAECTGTDATPMQVTRGGMSVGLLGVALRYMHTPCELLSLQDVENCAKLMAAYCRRITPETDFRPRRPH